MKAKIGIIICGLDGSRQYVSNSYIQSVRYSGGLPLVLPLVRSDQLLSQYLTLCDGFLFCGGGDITPLLFGEQPKNSSGQTDITLDLFQIRLMRLILSTPKPVLAICRGMQVLNTACGGTIWQDLSLIPGKVLDHTQNSSSRCDVSHRIRTEKKSRLRRFLGESTYVNSFHHQAVCLPGKGLKVTARSKDNVIEAVEAQWHPYVLGVQWHPECMYRQSACMRTLFQELITQAEKNIT